MPVEIVGMIGANPPQQGANVHVIAGAIDPDYLAEFARAHEDSDFDRVLIGYSSGSADAFLLGAYAGMACERLRFLIAHRPGFVAPTLAARKAATLDQFTRGRVALHIISGGADAEQRRDGDYADHDARYRRSAEYMQILRRTWTSTEPFDFAGEFYRVERALSDVRPYGESIPLYYGGQSAAALGAARWCDVFAMWGEPRAAVRQRMGEVRAATQPHGVTPRFSVSFRPILADTEETAWERARDILAGVEQSRERAGRMPLGSEAPRPEAVGSQRLLELARQGDVHDERLWLPIAAATGAPGNTSALVGTPEQVADALVRYYDLGVTTFLIRGFDPLADARDYGRELIPRLRVAVAERDAGAAAGAPQHAGTAQ